MREYDGVYLGIPMVEYDAGAAPFVVWEGSHEIIRQVLKHGFEGRSPEQWGSLDVTEIYHQARDKIFEQCQRVLISARPGEAYLAHRLTLHGISPWKNQANAGSDRRMICYFRHAISGPDGGLLNP